VESSSRRILETLMRDEIIAPAVVLADDGTDGLLTGHALKDRAAAVLARTDVIELDQDEGGGGEAKPGAEGGGAVQHAAANGVEGLMGDEMEEDETREVLSFQIRPELVRGRARARRCCWPPALNASCTRARSRPARPLGSLRTAPTPRSPPHPATERSWRG